MSKWWLPKRPSAVVFGIGYAIMWLIILLMPVLVPFGKVSLIFGWLPEYNFWATIAQVVMFAFMVATFFMERVEEQTREPSQHLSEGRKAST
ncbi:MAG: hypothetical protein D9V47_08670 [Clostridia bacterium]|nr:MAG: hypothetical protein D9V47_08670 [Clostridia bacterium]